MLDNDDEEDDYVYHNVKKTVMPYLSVMNTTK